MPDELLKPDEGYKITIGQREYEIPPAHWQQLVDIEKHMDCSIHKLGELMEQRMATTTQKVIWVLLQEKYPDLTEEEIGKSMNVSAIRDIGEILNDIVSQLLATE